MTTESSAAEEVAPRRTRRWLRRVVGGVLLGLLVAAAVIWWQREHLARSLITDMLDGYGIEATYDIEQIGPDRQVLRNLVIGDPAAPDATLDRAEIVLQARWGLPGVRRVKLSGLRLWGRVVDGQATFGALDPLIFTDSKEPFEFPDMVLEVDDARALIEGDYGPIAARLNGAGHLRGGFTGELAVVAPDLRLPGCAASNATLFGTVSVDAERPGFAGPLRFASLSCPDMGATLADGGVQLTLKGDRDMAGLEGTAGVQTGEGAFGATSMGALAGEGQFTFRDGNVTSSFDLQGRAIESGGLRLATADLDGTLRTAENFAQVELAADLAGSNLFMGPELDRQLASVASSAEGTLGRPLLDKLRRQLSGEMRGSSLAASMTLRRRDGALALVVPEARLRGRSGDSLLMLTAGQVLFGDEGLPRFAGNFTTGGEGLPRIAGRMEQDPGGALEMRLSMAEYSAGEARLALPQLRLRQSPGGALALEGRVEASGDLPGGYARGLEIPISGTVSAGGDIALWNGCTPVSFNALRVANLSLQGRRLTLCPPRGRPILRYDSRGLALAAGMPSLQLAGTLGETPLRLDAGAVGLAWPGALAARNLDVTLGNAGSATHVTIAELAARLGSRIEGTFAGATAKLDPVPLDIGQAGGTWSLVDGVLALSDMALTVTDRQAEARFDPLTARGASLVLADGTIRADARLAEARSGRDVTRVTIRHDLATGTGHADLAVPALVFDDGLQVAPSDCAARNPDTHEPTGRGTPGLTCLAQGVVALVEGTVTGSGVIDWNAEAVTSSGTFSTDSLDLAAAFGPVHGARGTIHFTDLLGMTTARGQVLHVASINPGIEVYEGDIAISIDEGRVINLERASWPFMGGTLTMRPISLNVGVEEVRRYVIEIEGLQAQRFIEHMQLGNIGATGVFDGTIPVVFDEMGNGFLEGGVLVSRPPGGSVSYIGELTYEDLTPIANYAFDALRALEYDRMQVDLNGSLIGELVTSVRFDGVRQGEGTQNNFITRQISQRVARLPIRFVVNIRAPFYSMMGSLRSLYDPSAVRDPRTLGLLSDDGTRFVPARPGGAASPAPVATPTPEPAIQPPEREAMP